jgi:hypothetical protein
MQPFQETKSVCLFITKVAADLSIKALVNRHRVSMFHAFWGPRGIIVLNTNVSMLPLLGTSTK